MLAASILIRVPFGISIRRNGAIIYVYIYIGEYAGARAYATHCSYNALLDPSAFYTLLCCSAVVCYGFLMPCRSAPSERLCYERSICSALCLTYTVCWNVGYAYILQHCLRYIRVSNPKYTQMMWWLVLFIHFIANQKNKNQDLHEHQNLCECLRKFLSIPHHTKCFSIHIMGRVLTPFLLQLLLLLLFVRTYIYSPCRFSWILAIDIFLGRQNSNLDVLFPFVSCLRFSFR